MKRKEENTMNLKEVLGDAYNQNCSNENTFL